MGADKKKTGIKDELVDLGRLAHRLTREGKYREAEEKFGQLLEMDRNQVFALVGLGDLKRKKKRFKDAVSYYQRALEIEKNNKFALLGLGDACR